MRRTLSLTAVCLVALGGCQRWKFWERSKQDVPVSYATEVAPPPKPASPPASPPPPEPPPEEPSSPAETPASSPAPIPLDELPHRRAASKPAPEPATTPARQSQTQPRVTSSRQVVAGAIIQVNRRFITVDDILTASALELAEIPTELRESAFRSRAEKIITAQVRKQVGQSLVMNEAEGALDENQKAMLDQEMEQTLAAMVAQAGGSRRKLEADLIRQGTTLEAVLENQRRELTVRWYLRSKFAPVVSVNRAMLWEYYTRHKDEYTSPKQVQMQIIAVPLSAFLAAGSAQPTEAELAAARSAARARIDRAAEALRAGEDFAEVARRFSSGLKAETGGLWPMMPVGSFRQERVEQVAFNQLQGQISDIIETDEGFFIVKTAAIEVGSTTSFEEAQNEIEQTLREQQLTKLYNDYYTNLLNEATIVQPENFVPLAVDEAVQRYHRRQSAAAEER